jgi:hypothetical protein
MAEVFPGGIVWLENILHELLKVSFLTICGRKHLANGFGETLGKHTNKEPSSYSDKEMGENKNLFRLRESSC